MANGKKYKFAFVHPDLGIGGAERLVLDVAGALSKQGHSVIFLTNHFDKNHAFDELKTGNYDVQIYGDFLPRDIFGKCHALFAYIRMIWLTFIYMIFYKSQDQADIYFVDLIPMAVPILKLFGEKVIYYCHHPDLLASSPEGSLKKFYRAPIDWIEAKATARADTILVNSEYTGSIFRDTFPDIKKPIQVLYPTVAYSFQGAITKLESSKPIHTLVPEIPDEPNVTVFLSVNRFHPAKKLELAIRAIEKLKDIPNVEFNKVFLILAGGYDPQSSINEKYYKQLQKLTETKGLQSKVIFLKSPSDDLKVDLLMACDCLLYTPEKEHFGIVPLEAMTVAKAVIACNSGGPRETVVPGSTGFLSEANPENMANFMAKMLDPAVAKSMGAAGKRLLKDKFSYESFCTNLNEIVEVCMNKKQA